MNTHLSLPIKSKEQQSKDQHGYSGKILHITDTHLFADDDSLLLGINTNASFKAVISEIKQQNDTFDLIVATGDFVQDGSNAAYLKFAQSINQLLVPCVWLPGNHDVYTKMTTVFRQQGLAENKVILLGDKWLIILLNSQVEGKAYGMLSSKELAFLSSTLDCYPERYTMVFLHHHPVMSDCYWLDQHCLKNHNELGNIIKNYPNIKSIGWGHIHQQLEKTWHHCQVFSTPSTCVQFEPLCYNFALTADPPAWRVIDLKDNGSIDTLVHSLTEDLFQPDLSLDGY